MAFEVLQDIKNKFQKTFIQSGTSDPLNFDAVIRRVETNNAKVSAHPVEQGFVVADHVTLSNKKLMVEGIISDANNSLLNLAIGKVSDAGAARITLKEIFEARKTITLRTLELEHKNMIITSLVFTKSSATRKEIRFTLRLEEIRVAVSQTGQVDAEQVATDIEKQIQEENQDSAANTGEKLSVGADLAGQIGTFILKALGRG